MEHQFLILNPTFRMPTQYLTQTGICIRKTATKLNVKFSESAKHELEVYKTKYENLRSLIIETCSLDPRPAWNIDGSDSKQYGVSFFGINIKFVVNGDVALITSLQKTD